MVDYRHNPDTGQIYAKLPGNRWVEIQEQDIGTLEEGGIEAFANSLGNSLGQLATGAGTLLGIEGAEEQFRDFQEAQQLRQEYNTTAGMLGSIAPDVAVGAVTGGTGTLAKRVGTTALVEGAIGAARNPDAPVTGALVGGGLGALGGAAAAGIARAARPRTAALPPNAPMSARTSAAISDNADDMRLRNRSITQQTADLGGGPGSIVGTTTAEMAEATQRGLTARIAGVFEADPPPQSVLDEATRLGLKLSPADLKGSVANKNIESMMQSNPTAQAVFESEIMRPNQRTLNKLSGKAAGFAEDTSEGITPEMMGMNADRIGKGFDDAAAQVPMKDINVAQVERKAMQDVILPEVEDAVGRVLAKVPPKADGRSGLEYIQRVRESAAGQWRQGNAEMASALDEIADEVERQLFTGKGVSKEVKETLNKLRNEWKAQRLLERAGVLTEEGDVAFGSLRQSMRSSKYLDKAYRRARDMGSPEFNDLASATRIMAQFRERIGNSGTATRSINVASPRMWLGYPLAKGYLSGGIPGGVAGAAPGAAATGLGIYGGANTIMD
ncbi:hypothetical protein [Primorskyibacter sp. S87]|uniref:hypothetical protein n=1 Tax=Primorskyibacter sp. S87 TaxID=3415126 RepID=UPI003C7E4F6F